MGVGVLIGLKFGGSERGCEFAEGRRQGHQKNAVVRLKLRVGKEGLESLR